MVGNENHELAFLFNSDLDAPQTRLRAGFLSLDQNDHFIAEDVRDLGNRPLLNHARFGIVLEPGDELHFVQFKPPIEILIATVEAQHRPGLESMLSRHRNIVISDVLPSVITANCGK